MLTDKHSRWGKTAGKGSEGVTDQAPTPVAQPTLGTMNPSTFILNSAIQKSKMLREWDADRRRVKTKITQNIMSEGTARSKRKGNECNTCKEI